jgi:glycerophosphoryl diester phosphodiesterase
MKNRNNVDVDYFRNELTTLLQSLENRTLDELQRYLMKLADVASPLTFIIDYDDNPLIILAKTEKALNAIGFNIEFKDDGLSHDGFMIFNIERRL